MNKYDRIRRDKIIAALQKAEVKAQDALLYLDPDKCNPVEIADTQSALDNICNTIQMLKETSNSYE